MLLILDVGNSNVTAGLWRDPNWIGEWRISTDRRRTTDEYGVLLGALLQHDGHELREINGAVMSSVVPELVAVMVELTRSEFGVEPIVLSPGIKSGLEIVYDPATSLGPDRLAACVAARDLFGAPVVVVDFGTATTISVVDAAGRLIGGAIAPGVGIAAEALTRAGARLPRIALEPGDIAVIGRTTAQSMRSGALLGHAAAISHLLRAIDRELETEDGKGATVVATGGWSGTLAPLVPRIDAIEPRLVLDGLRLIWQLGRESR